MDSINNLNMENMDMDFAMESADMEVDMDFDLPKTTTSLLRLDDMVLSKIMEHLSVDDLSNLAETCVRLADLSAEHFRKQHGSLTWKKNSKISLTSSERVWARFGEHVKDIKLYYFDSEELNTILIMLTKHCKNVEVVTLNCVDMKDPHVFEESLFAELFSRLKKCELVQCSWTRWCPLSLFFGDDNSALQQLSIIRCCKSSSEKFPLSLSGFTSLTKLNVLHSWNVLSNAELEECFSCNKITSLAVSDVGNVNLFNSDDGLIDALANTLETLVIDHYIFDFSKLLRLKRLKSLTLHCGTNTNIDSLLQTFKCDKVVEELVFNRIIITEATVKALSTFKGLTSLRLNRCQNTVDERFFRSLPSMFPQLYQFVYAHSENKDENILHVVKSMPKLGRLSLYGGSALKTETYFEIEKIVNSDWFRPKLELIPPNFSTLKELRDIESIRKSILLRIDVYHRLNALVKV